MKFLSGRVSKTILLFSCLLLFAVRLAFAADYDEIFSKANDAMAIGDLPAAITLLKEVPLDRDDESGAFARSRMQVAKLHFALQELDAATAAAREVLAVYPDHSEALNFIASVQQELKPRYVTFLEDCLRFCRTCSKGR